MGNRSGVTHVPESELGNLAVAGVVLANLGHIVRGDVDVGARDGGHRTRRAEDTLLDDGDVGGLDGLNVLVVLLHHRLVLVLLVLVNFAHPGRGRGGTLALLKPGGLARGGSRDVVGDLSLADGEGDRLALGSAGGDWGVDGDALLGGPGLCRGGTGLGGELGDGTGVADVADPVRLDFRVGAAILAHRGGLGDVGVPPVGTSLALDAGEVLAVVGRDTAANFGLAVVRGDDAHLLHDLVVGKSEGLAPVDAPGHLRADALLGSLE